MNDMTPSQANPVPPVDSQKPPMRPHKALWVLAALIVIGLAASGVWLWWQSNNPPVSEQDRQSQVVIASGGFSPATIKVKRGQSVTWINNDVTAHRLAADSATDDKIAGLDSEDQLNAGDSFTYTFGSSGTFRYQDPASPVKFNGVVIVE